MGPSLRPALPLLGSAPSYLLRDLPVRVWTLGLHIQALPVASAKSCHLATLWAYPRALSTLRKRNPGERPWEAGSWSFVLGIPQSQLPKRALEGG